jgi:hypothetical protein
MVAASKLNGSRSTAMSSGKIKRIDDNVYHFFVRREETEEWSHAFTAVRGAGSSFDIHVSNSTALAGNLELRTDTMAMGIGETLGLMFEFVLADDSWFWNKYPKRFTSFYFDLYRSGGGRKEEIAFYFHNHFARSVLSLSMFWGFREVETIPLKPSCAIFECDWRESSLSSMIRRKGFIS